MVVDAGWFGSRSSFSVLHLLPSLRGHRLDVRAPAVRRRSLKRTSKPVRAADVGEKGAVDPVDHRPVVLAGAEKRLPYSRWSATKRSWHCRRPKGCSSGSESARLVSAPLLTCMRMSPPASRRGRRTSPERLRRQVVRRQPVERRVPLLEPERFPHLPPEGDGLSPVAEVLRGGVGQQLGAERQQAMSQAGEDSTSAPRSRAIALGIGSGAGRHGSRPGRAGRRWWPARRSGGCRRRWRGRRGTPSCAGSRASLAGRRASRTMALVWSACSATAPWARSRTCGE